MRNSPSLARIEFGNQAGDNFLRYPRVQQSDTVIRVAGYEAAHLGKLLRLAGVTS